MAEARIHVATIPCRVSRGMFSDERAVLLDLPGEGRVSVLVDERSVKVSRDPGPDEEVDGRLNVYIVAEEGENVVLDLPQPSITGGSRVIVPRRLVSFS